MSGENYKVSALKFRPQRFSDVVSQEFVTQTLLNAIKSGKIAHSYLLSGPRGVGKTTIARILAKALNCTDPDNNEPCSKCEHCIEITKGVHPDIFELDAASNRGIDDVRAIQDAAKYYPLKAKYKFFIVDEVHMLTTQAFNALLKILEEPPSYLIFVLATTNPEKIPQTIQSRCQRFALHRLKIPEIVEKLKAVSAEEKVKIDDESLFLIAKLGDGSLRDALGIYDMAISYCGNKIVFADLKEFMNLPGKEVFFNLSDYISKGAGKEILKYFNDLQESGFDVINLYNGLVEHFRNLLVVKTTGKADLLDESDAVKADYIKQAENFTADNIRRISKLLFDADYRLKNSSAQKIFIEIMLYELCRINDEVLDIAELVSGLEALKKKIPELDFGYELSRISDSEYPARDSIAVEVKKESLLISRLRELFNIEEYQNGINQ